MMDSNKLRQWATPLTIGAFILMAMTGLLMFFHLQTGLVKPAHEWLSLVMVSAVGLHLLVNWRAFKRYFTQKIGIALIGLFTILTITAIAYPSQEGRAGGPPDKQAVSLVLNLPMSSLASITHKNVESIQAQLSQKGFTISDPNASLKQIAETNKRSPMEALATALK